MLQTETISPLSRHKQTLSKKSRNAASHEKLAIVLEPVKSGNQESHQAQDTAEMVLQNHTSTVLNSHHDFTSGKPENLEANE